MGPLWRPVEWRKRMGVPSKPPDCHCIDSLQVESRFLHHCLISLLLCLFSSHWIVVACLCRLCHVFVVARCLSSLWLLDVFVNLSVTCHRSSHRGCIFALPYTLAALTWLSNKMLTIPVYDVLELWPLIPHDWHLCPFDVGFLLTPTIPNFAGFESSK